MDFPGFDRVATVEVCRLAGPPDRVRTPGPMQCICLLGSGSLAVAQTRQTLEPRWRTYGDVSYSAYSIVVLGLPAIFDRLEHKLHGY